MTAQSGCQITKEEKTLHRINAPIPPIFRQPRKQDLFQIRDHMHTRIHWLPLSRRTFKHQSMRDYVLRLIHDFNNPKMQKQPVKGRECHTHIQTRSLKIGRHQEWLHQGQH